MKPANILINEDCSVKICDFGLARAIGGLENTKKYIIDAYKEAQGTEEMHGDVGGSGPNQSIEAIRMKDESVSKEIFEGVVSEF